MDGEHSEGLDSMTKNRASVREQNGVIAWPEDPILAELQSLSLENLRLRNRLKFIDIDVSAFGIQERAKTIWNRNLSG